MLRRETGTTIGDWLFEDILCRWGGLTEIVSDNGPPFIKALDYLAKKYNIHHIRISGYNSRANGLVERTHFDVRQALFKLVDGDQSKWSQGAYSVFWADRVTIRRRMGCSPYFAATGTHPILPLDIAEATYLLPPPTSTLSTTDLIAIRAIALQKRHGHLSALHSRVMAARLNAAVRFEREHAATIRDFDFRKGDLVLVRNTAIEKALNRKMRARYIGPLVVISRNKEAHILSANSTVPYSTDLWLHSESSLTSLANTSHCPTSITSSMFPPIEFGKWRTPKFPTLTPTMSSRPVKSESMITTTSPRSTPTSYLRFPLLD